MQVIPGFFRQFWSLGLWGGTCGVFSFLMASGNVALGIALLGTMIYYVMVLMGPQLLAAFWLLGQPTIFPFPNQVLKGVPFITMERALLLTLIGLMVARMIFVKTERNRLLRIEVLILIYLGYLLASLVITTTSASLRQDLWFFIQYLIPLSMFVVSRRIRWHERNITLLLVGMTGVGVFMGLIGMMQVLLGIDVFIAEYQTLTSGHANRAHGAFSNAHTYTATLLIFFVLTLYQYSLTRNKLFRFLQLGAMLIMLVGIFLGQTRAPWIGFALAMFIILVRDRDVRNTLLLGGLLLVIAGIFALPFMFDHLEGLVERLTNLNTLGGRLAVWATAINMFAHNPIFGVGFGADSFLLNKPTYITGIGSLPQQAAVYLAVPHNEYLHQAILLGITGLALFVMILRQALKLLFAIESDRNSGQSRQKLALYVASILIGLMFNSLFSDTFIQDYFWMLAFFLAGLVVGMRPGFDYNPERATEKSLKNSLEKRSGVESYA